MFQASFPSYERTQYDFGQTVVVDLADSIDLTGEPATYLVVRYPTGQVIRWAPVTLDVAARTATYTLQRGDLPAYGNYLVEVFVERTGAPALRASQEPYVLRVGKFLAAQA